MMANPAANAASSNKTLVLLPAPGEPGPDLVRKLQERYGWDRDRAQTEVRAFEKSLRDDT